VRDGRSITAKLSFEPSLEAVQNLSESIGHSTCHEMMLSQYCSRADCVAKLATRSLSCFVRQGPAGSPVSARATTDMFREAWPSRRRRPPSSAYRPALPDVAKDRAYPFHLGSSPTRGTFAPPRPGPATEFCRVKAIDAENAQWYARQSGAANEDAIGTADRLLGGQKTDGRDTQAKLRDLLAIEYFAPGRF
jgi:hypothetical protein